MKVVLCAFLFGILTKYITVSAIDCYHCSACGVPFDEDDVSTEDCENNSCMKLNITHKGRVSIVSRGCSVHGVEKEGCELKEVSGTMSEICYCNSDECNGSPSLKLNFSIWMLCVLIIAPVFIVKFINL